MDPLIEIDPTGAIHAQALCSRLNPEIWFDPDTLGLARHICLNHCPVLDRCQSLAPSLQIHSGVIAGLYWRSSKQGKKSRPIKNQPVEVICLDCFQRLADVRKTNFRCVICGRRSAKYICGRKCQGTWKIIIRAAEVGKVYNGDIGIRSDSSDLGGNAT